MNSVYEYRKAPNRGVIWLSVSAVLMLMLAVMFAGANEFARLVWAGGAVALCWMLMPKPVAGIRIDNDYLILSAWRRPHPIPLDEIAYLRATEASAETDIAIVFKDGREEGTFSGDMPEIETLIAVLAQRGIAIRDVS